MPIWLIRIAMFKLYGYLKHTWWQALLSVLLLSIRIMADLTLPDYMMRIIDQGIVTGDIATIMRLGGQMLVVAGLVAVLFATNNFIASYLGAKAADRIRRDLFRTIEGFSLVEFDRFSPASLITRSTSDIAQVQQILTMSFRILLAAPITGILAFFKAVNLTPQLSWIFAVGLPLMLGVVFAIMRFTSARFRKVQQLTDRLNLNTRENLTGIRVIRAFNAQTLQHDKFETLNDEVYVNNTSLLRIVALNEPLITIVVSLTTVLILWFSIDMIGSRAMQIGQLMAFMQYTNQVMSSFMHLSGIFNMIPRAIISGNRITEVLSTQPTITDPIEENPIQPTLKGHLEFKNVFFRYPDAQEDVLHDLSFVAKPGTLTAFIGSTGSGKSTLVNLIPRLYDVTSGQILVDGVDVRHLRQFDLRQRIGYVPQKGMLLSGSIRENLTFGNPQADDSALDQAIKIAQAETFIREKPDQLDHRLAQAATNISGGQKQRLSIARALTKNADILIFDDSFSALDFKTDAALRKALHQHLRETTVFVVGQRVSTIMGADQIIVLEHGHIAGIGTHPELMTSCPVYQEIAASQLTAEELA
jgi:ATP-binding cassette, subfamily B, multidrug efflux pump